MPRTLGLKSEPQRVVENQETSILMRVPSGFAATSTVAELAHCARQHFLCLNVCVAAMRFAVVAVLVAAAPVDAFLPPRCSRFAACAAGQR